MNSGAASYKVEEIEFVLMVREARTEKNTKALDSTPRANIAAKFQGEGNSKKWQVN